MTIFKRIGGKPGEMTLGLLSAVVVSLLIIAFCIIQMAGYEHLKLGWFLFFVATNIIYIDHGMKKGWIKGDSMNGMVIASGPLAFYFWTVVGVWNKYIANEGNKKSLKGSEKSLVVANALAGVANNDPVNVTIKSLNELSDEITEKLKKFDVFDIDVPTVRIKAFLKILKARDFEWMPTDFVYDNKETIVVGKKGADFSFDLHEEER